MLKAITASKKKNDKVDARTIADLLRCNLLPECYIVLPVNSDRIDKLESVAHTSTPVWTLMP
jgi:hypothetical protein